MPKKMKYFLEETIFQVRGVVGYQAPGQLASVLVMKVLNPADVGFTHT